MGKVGVITEHERLRRLTHRSVTELAREIGFSHSYVSQVESGRVRPSLRYRKAVARALGMPEGVLFGDEHGRQQDA